MSTFERLSNNIGKVALGVIGAAGLALGIATGFAALPGTALAVGGVFSAISSAATWFGAATGIGSVFSALGVSGLSTGAMGGIFAGVLAGAGAVAVGSAKTAMEDPTPEEVKANTSKAVNKYNLKVAQTEEAGIKNATREQDAIYHGVKKRGGPSKIEEAIDNGEADKRTSYAKKAGSSTTGKDWIQKVIERETAAPARGA